MGLCRCGAVVCGDHGPVIDGHRTCPRCRDELRARTTSEQQAAAARRRQEFRSRAIEQVQQASTLGDLTALFRLESSGYSLAQEVGSEAVAATIARCFAQAGLALDIRLFRVSADLPVPRRWARPKRWEVTELAGGWTIWMNAKRGQDGPVRTYVLTADGTVWEENDTEPVPLGEAFQGERVLPIYNSPRWGPPRVGRAVAVPPPPPPYGGTQAKTRWRWSVPTRIAIPSAFVGYFDARRIPDR